VRVLINSSTSPLSSLLATNLANVHICEVCINFPATVSVAASTPERIKHIKYAYVGIENVWFWVFKCISPNDRNARPARMRDDFGRAVYYY